MNLSPPGHLDNTAPDSLGDPSGNAAVSGRSAGRSPTSGGPASGSPASRRSVGYAGVPPSQFSGSTASGHSTSGSPDIQGNPQGTVSNIHDIVHGTASSIDEDVPGAVTSTPHPNSEQDDSEAAMELSQPKGEESNMFREETNEEFETQEQLMSRAGTIVNDWISRIMGGREAALVLPWADPVIPLVKEVADHAQFSLTEKPAENEDDVELVHEGAEGPWSDLSMTDS